MACKKAKGNCFQYRYRISQCALSSWRRLIDRCTGAGVASISGRSPLTTPSDKPFNEVIQLLRTQHRSTRRLQINRSWGVRTLQQELVVTNEAALPPSYLDSALTSSCLTAGLTRHMKNKEKILIYKPQNHGTCGIRTPEHKSPESTHDRRAAS